MYEQLAIAALGAGGQMASAPPAPAVSSADGAVVNVGGLNVPAFPNFPAGFLSNSATGQTLTANNNLIIFSVVALVALIAFKKIK